MSQSSNRSTDHGVAIAIGDGDPVTFVLPTDDGTLEEPLYEMAKSLEASA